MPNTMPEGFAPFTPAPYPPEPQIPAVGSKWFLHILSSIVGLLVGGGVVFGVLGKAFYVERTEYSQKLLKDVQDSATFTAGLDKISSRLERQEGVLNRLDANLDRLTADVQSLKLAEAARRRRP